MIRHESRRLDADNLPAGLAGYAGRRVAVSYFDSRESFAALPVSRGSWSRGAKYASDDAADRLRAVGDLSTVKRASAMLDRIAADLQTDRREWVNSVAGAFPDVPAAIIGLPEAMMDHATCRDDSTPVNVVIDLTSSAGISDDVMERRGVAALALAMRIAERRPMTLSTVTGLSMGGGAALAVVPIPAAPLDLAHAAPMFAAPLYPRGIGYDFLKHTHGAGGGWAFNGRPFGGGAEVFSRLMRAALLLGPNDIYIGPAFVGDQMLNKPEAWIAARLAEVEAAADFYD